MELISYLKKFFKYFKESKNEFLRYSAFSLIAGILELFGVALIYPFVLKILSDNPIDKSGISPLFIGVLVIIIFLLKNIFMIFFIFIQTKFTSNLEFLIKQKFMNFFLFANYQDTYKITLSEKNKIFNLLIPNFMNNFVMRLLNLNVNLFIFCFISALLAIKFPLATALTAIFSILTIKVQNKIYKPLLTKYAEKISKITLFYQQIFNETVLNLKEIKIFRKELFFYNKFNNSLNIYCDKNQKSMFLNQIPPYITEPFAIILLFILFSAVSLSSYTEPEKLIASFALIASAIFRLAPTISRIQVNLNGLNLALPMVKELTNFYEKYNIYEEIKGNITKKEAEFNKSIELKNVSFKYNNSNKNALNNINIKINKGEYIGIAGISGAGKTTLLDIIAGLFNPTAGSILIDNKIKEGKLNIGYIPQEFNLIPSTIRENVAFGNKEIDDSKVIKALKNAQLYNFIKTNYPNGIYDNIDTNDFSQGQKQRLAIARALYNEPEILILDEATSSLDLKIEDEICNVLNDLKGSKTIIVVAHRLATIKSADKIIYLQNGFINAIAPFDELINISQDFKDLVKISDKI